jgi:hypothetical protein
MPLLLGCLFIVSLSVAPRLVLLLAWLFSPRWDIVWRSQWLLPLLGILFLPYTTILYLLTWSPAGIQGWDWMWIILGVFMDIVHWGQVGMNRKGIPRGYPEGYRPPQAL